MLAIPYAAEGRFVLNAIIMADWPTLAIVFTIRMVRTITASIFLSERLTDMIRILGEYPKSNETPFQEFGGQYGSLNVIARGVHTTYCFCDF